MSRPAEKGWCLTAGSAVLTDDLLQMNNVEPVMKISSDVMMCYGLLALLSFFLLFQEGQLVLNRCDNIVDLSLDHAYILVNLYLVGLIDLGQAEESHQRENNQGDAIQQAANVCRNPQQKAKLERVHQVLNEEEPAQLSHGLVQVVEQRGDDSLQLVLLQPNVHV